MQISPERAELIGQRCYLHWIEEIGSSLAALKWLWDQLVVGREMRPAVDARVRPVRWRQIGLKSLDHFAGFLAGCGRFGRVNFVLETRARKSRVLGRLSPSGSLRLRSAPFAILISADFTVFSREGKNLSFNCCLGWCLLFDSVMMFNFQFLVFFVVFSARSFTHCG